MTGPEEYVRHVRAHHNTLEHLVLFLPGMWLFAYHGQPVVGSGDRQRVAADAGALCAGLSSRRAERRLIPLYISMPPIYIFVLGSLIGGIVAIGGRSLRHGRI